MTDLPPDRNKTPLTHAVTETAYRYLADRGFKPLEKECYIADRWIADIAGVCTPSQTEAANLRLIKRAPKWERSADDAAQAAQQAAREAWTATYTALLQPLTALVEVKTSVSDYSGDRKWTAIKPVNLCYVAMPEGMIPRERWPEGWGVILTTTNGLNLRKVHPPQIAPMTPEAQMWTVFRVANRMHNRVCYGKMAERQRAQRLEEAQYTTTGRFRDVVKVVLAIMGGKPADEALRYWGIRAKLPQDVLDQLEALRPKL